MVGWRRAGLAWLLAVVGLTACLGGGPPPDAPLVSFASSDPVFLDDLLAPGRQPAAGRRISGMLMLPQDASSPVPGAVILHTSRGPGPLEWSMAAELAAAGIASLVVDSFGPRGVRRAGYDQTLVTEATMMADAYGALAFLADHPLVRRDRIAVIGFSKGAAVALYTAMAPIAERMPGAANLRFAAHLAFYPWCGLSLFDRRTTGAPVMIHMGERDDLVSPALCGEFVESLRRSDPAAPVELLLYPGARHAFNHPMLTYLAPIALQFVQNPGTCRVVETEPGAYREISSGQPLDHASYREVLAGCLGYGGLVGYDGAAAALAGSRSLAFLRQALFAP